MDFEGLEVGNVLSGSRKKVGLKYYSPILAIRDISRDLCCRIYVSYRTACIRLGRLNNAAILQYICCPSHEKELGIVSKNSFRQPVYVYALLSVGTAEIYRNFLPVRDTPGQYRPISMYILPSSEALTYSNASFTILGISWYFRSPFERICMYTFFSIER